VLPRSETGGVIGTIVAPSARNCSTAARRRSRIPGDHVDGAGFVSVSIVEPIRRPSNGLRPGRGAIG